MNKEFEELIEHAKILYKPGVTFISPQNNRTYTSIEDLNSRYPTIFCDSHEKYILSTVSPGRAEYVYFNKKWAEVIKPKTINEKRI